MGPARDRDRRGRRALQRPEQRPARGGDARQRRDLRVRPAHARRGARVRRRLVLPRRQGRLGRDGRARIRGLRLRARRARRRAVGRAGRRGRPRRGGRGAHARGRATDGGGQRRDRLGHGRVAARLRRRGRGSARAGPGRGLAGPRAARRAGRARGDGPHVRRFHGVRADRHARRGGPRPRAHDPARRRGGPGDRAGAAARLRRRRARRDRRRRARARGVRDRRPAPARRPRPGDALARRRRRRRGADRHGRRAAEPGARAVARDAGDGPARRPPGRARPRRPVRRGADGGDGRGRARRRRGRGARLDPARVVVRGLLGPRVLRDHQPRGAAPRPEGRAGAGGWSPPSVSRAASGSRSGWTPGRGARRWRCSARGSRCDGRSAAPRAPPGGRDGGAPVAPGPYTAPMHAARGAPSHPTTPTHAGACA